MWLNSQWTSKNRYTDTNSLFEPRIVILIYSNPSVGLTWVLITGQRIKGPQKQNRRSLHSLAIAQVDHNVRVQWLKWPPKLKTTFWAQWAVVRPKVRPKMSMWLKEPPKTDTSTNGPHLAFFTPVPRILFLIYSNPISWSSLVTAVHWNHLSLNKT